MEKNSAASLLTSVDSLFTTQEERDIANRPRVQEIPVDKIDDFPNHPFKIRMDDSMIEMAESVKQHGILVPAIVRPKENGHYEMVAGHRRKLACTLIAKLQLPCIVRELTDEEATIIMVDSNLQREQLLPSEKAFAYKMKLDAMRRQAGRPSRDNSATLLQNFGGKTSRELLADQAGESHEQIRKYIRLTGSLGFTATVLALRWCLALILPMPMAKSRCLIWLLAPIMSKKSGIRTAPSTPCITAPVPIRRK